jgi:3-deoxy-7-phosphoheptulonate synthase
MSRTDTARTDIARPDQEPGLRASTRDTTRIDDTRIEAVRPLITPPC